MGQSTLYFPALSDCLFCIAISFFYKRCKITYNKNKILEVSQEIREVVIFLRMWLTVSGVTER